MAAVERREVHLTIPIAPEMEMVATALVAPLAELMDLGRDKIDEVKMAFVEACINAFEHSDTPDRRVLIDFVTDATSWRDSVFNQPLRFYLFDLPFYTLLRRYLLGLAILSAAIYWITARGWQLVRQLPEMQEIGQIDPRMFRLEGALESRFLRGVAAVVLVALALGAGLRAAELTGVKVGDVISDDDGSGGAGRGRHSRRRGDHRHTGGCH